MTSLKRAAGVLVAAMLVGGLTTTAGPASSVPRSARKASLTPQVPFYHPRLFVIPAALWEGTPSATSATSIGFERDLGATAKLVLFAPEAASIRLDQAPGTLVGTPGVRIDVARTTLAFEPRAGSIVAADPSTSATDPQAQACAPGRHTAVWLLRAKATKNYARGPTPKLTITLPVYIDRITPSQANMFSAYEFQICFGSPNKKQVTPGWPAGAIIRRLTINLSQDVITEQPTLPGTYVWRGVFTPYTASGLPSPSGAVESRAIVLLPVELALSGSYDPARRAIDVSGTLTEGGVPVVGDGLVIWHGTALGAGWSGIANAKRVIAQTDVQGRFSQSIPAAQTTYIRASLSTLSMAYVDSTGCTPPALAPKGCVTATKAGFTVMSSLATVVLP
jgi:hypothetical protein